MKFIIGFEKEDEATLHNYWDEIIVFKIIKKSRGKVYDQHCNKIMCKDYNLENTEWVSNNHWCVPLYYKGE
jgi:hypothetical protein